MKIQSDKSEGTEKKIWGPFIINISLIILIFTIGIFIGFFIRNKQLINREIMSRAKSHFNSIVLTRKWNANYGGVFVEKKEGIISNPYLENPDITALNGKIYTKKNPALMTREISELAQEKDLLSFHITSLNPINPHNKPDEFETKALDQFEHGIKESYRKDKINDKIYFRYMAPLLVDKNCLQCHAKQGYKVGDVRGGISVIFDISDIEHTLNVDKYIFFSLSALAAILLLGLIYLFIVRLMRKLNEAQKKIQEMAITDELTQLLNRRYLFNKLTEEIERAKRYKRIISCIMIDIDYFKKVNDKYGHHTGDLILQDVSRIIKNTCRESDTAARYGGEEICVLLPETDGNGAIVTANRIRELIENNKTITEKGDAIQVTISLGVASLALNKMEKINRIDQIVQYADEALYKAKEGGRNRVEVYGNS